MFCVQVLMSLYKQKVVFWYLVEKSGRSSGSSIDPWKMSRVPQTLKVVPCSACFLSTVQSHPMYRRTVINASKKTHVCIWYSSGRWIYRLLFLHLVSTLSFKYFDQLNSTIILTQTIEWCLMESDQNEKFSKFQKHFFNVRLNGCAFDSIHIWQFAALRYANAYIKFSMRT